MPVKKANKRIKTELPVTSDGHYDIKNEAQALVALKKAAKLVEQIEEIKFENDLAGKEATYEELRKALSKFQTKNEIVEISDDGWKSLLVERTGSRWIWDDNDIAALPDHLSADGDIKPLKSIIESKYRSNATAIIRRVTRRVLDTAKLDDLVKRGTLTVEDISPAFLNFVQTTYVKIGKK